MLPKFRRCVSSLHLGDAGADSSDYEIAQRFFWFYFDQLNRMFNAVGTQDDVASLKCRIAKKHGITALYGINARHRRAVRNERIVMSIDDQDGVCNNGRRHCFGLNVTGTNRDKSFPAFSVQGSPGTQMIEISGGELE